MANTKQTKKYLGGWDTSAYDDVSKASQQAYQTNWDILKNRYNNLVEQETRKDEIARQNYNKALASQLTTDLQTQDAVNRALASRGMSNSGLRQRYLEQQLGSTGDTVNKALSQLLNTSLGNASSLYSGLGDLLSGGIKLDTQQGADQLDIISKKIAADMEGQQLAASLAESEAQRALRNSLSGSNSKEKELEDDYNEQMRQLAVWNILNDINPETGEKLDMSNAEKTYYLYTMYDVKNAKDLVNSYDVVIKNEPNKKITNLQNKIEEAKTSKWNTLGNQLTNYVELTAPFSPVSLFLTPYAEINRQWRNNRVANLEKQLESLFEQYGNPEDYKNMTIQDYYDKLYEKR